MSCDKYAPLGRAVCPIMLIRNRSFRAPMKIVLFYAMRKEIASLLSDERIECAESAAGVNFYRFSENLIACSGGIGKVNAAMATQLCIDRYAPDLIINVGVAGCFVNTPSARLCSPINSFSTTSTRLDAAIPWHTSARSIASISPFRTSIAPNAHSTKSPSHICAGSAPRAIGLPSVALDPMPCATTSTPSSSKWKAVPSPKSVCATIRHSSLLNPSLTASTAMTTTTSTSIKP